MEREINECESKRGEVGQAATETRENDICIGKDNTAPQQVREKVHKTGKPQIPFKRSYEEKTCRAVIK